MHEAKNQLTTSGLAASRVLVWTVPHGWHAHMVYLKGALSFSFFAVVVLCSLENPLTFIASWDPRDSRAKGSPGSSEERTQAWGTLRSWPGPHTLLASGRRPVSQRQPLILILGGVGPGQEDKLLVPPQCPGGSQWECDWARVWSVRATQAWPWASSSIVGNQAGLVHICPILGPLWRLATWERLRAGSGDSGRVPSRPLRAT